MYLFNLATGQKADASEFFFGGIVLSASQTLVDRRWGRFGETNLVGVQIGCLNLLHSFYLAVNLLSLSLKSQKKRY